MQIRELCSFTNLRFTYHTESELKIVFKKLQGITVDQYLNFNKYIANICESADTFNALSSDHSSYLSTEKGSVSSSSTSNSFTVLLFGCLILYSLIKKSTNCLGGIYNCPNGYTTRYDERLSKPGLVNIHIKNI